MTLLTRCVRWLAAVLFVSTVMAQPSVYQQAVSQLQSGQIAAAIALLERTLEQSPGDLKARTLLGMALTAAGRRDEANRRYREALRQDLSFSPALKNLAINEMAAGDSARARVDFERLLSLTPADPVAHLALAELDFAARQFAESAAHYEQTGDLYRKDPGNVLKYAQACMELKQTARAAAVLTHMPQEADAATHLAAGALLAKTAEYAAAAHEFELARNLHPGDYDAGFNLVLAYTHTKQYPAAVRVGEEMMAHGHRRAELYNVLAQAYENSGRTKEAYEALRTATQIDPADETNYLDLIALCLTHKNYDLALEIAGIGTARLPSSSRLELQRGIAFAMKEQFREAEGAFQKALQLAPDQSLPHVALGLVLMQMDRVPEAVEVLRRRVQSGRGDYIALWFLGEALSRGGAAPGSPEQKEALGALEKSVHLNPNIAQTRVLLAKLLMRSGQVEQAGTHLERALQLEPGNIAAQYQLAQVYSRKGDAARAKALFAKVSQAKAEDREQFTRGGLQQIIREGAR